MAHLKKLTDKQRLLLIKEAVEYCQKVEAMGMPASCYSKALREPIFFLWEARLGKKQNIAKYKSIKSIGLSYGKGEIIYDHAIPFRYLQKSLLNLRHPNIDEIFQLLTKHETAVIITKTENSILNKLGLNHKMPDDWDGADPLARYKKADIEIIPTVSD